MIAILAAAGTATAVAMFCLGHKYGYQKAVADWHMKRKGETYGKQNRS